jgi:hypothetical protein
MRFLPGPSAIVDLSCVGEQTYLKSAALPTSAAV